MHLQALPLKLRAAGYTTNIIGKWDMGWASKHHSPEGRGYDHSLCYAEHMNNYWSQKVEPTGTNCATQQGNSTHNTFYDLWRDGAPAADLVDKGMYIEDIFQARVLETIANFTASRATGGAKKLYLDYRPHSMHWPLMVDEEAFNQHNFVTDDEANCQWRFYGDRPWSGAPASAYACRRLFQAMLSNLDRRLGEVVDALVAAGLWNDTLMTFMSDNGGTVKIHENAANNWPLRSGKYHPFEGGIRVAAMWSGGYIPISARGTTSHALVSVADYYATFCELGGLSPALCAADPLAESAGLPAIDSRNVWEAVVHNGAPVRNELPIDKTVLLLVNDTRWWKLFTQKEVPGAGWTGPVFPNSTSPDPDLPTMTCESGGCLFDVMADPGETHDLARQFPDVAAAMGARLAVLVEGFYSNSDAGGQSMCPISVKQDCLCWAAQHLWGNFVGPFHKW
jgi:arylsulfatase B